MKKLFLCVMPVITLALEAGACNATVSGTLTITNIPSRYNGMYVFMEAELENSEYGELYGALNINIENEEDIKLVQISDGKVSIPLWIIKSWDTGEIVRFTDNDRGELEISIYDSPTLDGDMITAVYFESVVFIKGNSTKSFFDGELL